MPFLCYNTLHNPIEILKVMSHPLTYFMHDMENVEHTVSLQKVGQMLDTDLDFLFTQFPVCEPIGWDFVEKGDNTGYSQSRGIDPAIFSQDDFLKFNFHDTCFDFDDYLFERYPSIIKESVSTAYCEASYANLHDDANSVKSRGQIMFIFSNESKHTFVSIDDSGVTHELTPKAGDIVFMDIACKHALLPKHTNIESLDEMKPLKMALIAINDF